MNSPGLHYGLARATHLSRTVRRVRQLGNKCERASAPDNEQTPLALQAFQLVLAAIREIEI
jgi:hypothetical protein